jgi:hypothetical protein
MHTLHASLRKRESSTVLFYITTRLPSSAECADVWCTAYTFSLALVTEHAKSVQGNQSPTLILNGSFSLGIDHWPDSLIQKLSEKANKSPMIQKYCSLHSFLLQPHSRGPTGSFTRDSRPFKWSIYFCSTYMLLSK